MERSLQACCETHAWWVRTYAYGAGCEIEHLSKNSQCVESPYVLQLCLRFASSVDQPEFLAYHHSTQGLH